MKIGVIGAGDVGQRLAKLILKTGNEVILCNSRGPETLKDTIESLGDGATAGTLQEVAWQEIVILAVWWDNAPAVLNQINDFDGRILIDATNQLTITENGPRPAVLSNVTGSEYIAALTKNARVVKAFNSLFGQYMDGDVEGGQRVLFYAGDDEDAKATLHQLFEAMGFYPVNLGRLAEGGKLMEVGGALNGKHFIKRNEDMCI